MPRMKVVMYKYLQNKQTKRNLNQDLHHQRIAQRIKKSQKFIQLFNLKCKRLQDKKRRVVSKMKQSLGIHLRDIKLKIGAGVFRKFEIITKT